MKKNPLLSIIITSYHQPEVLKLSIQSIVDTIENLDYEVIVSDGETQEKTNDLMREEFPRVRFFPHQDNVGFEKLVNKGLKMARGKYLLVINSDIIFKEGSIAQLIAYFEKTKKIGLLGPRLINFDGSFQFSCFRFYSPLTILYRRTFLGNFSWAKKHLAKFKYEKELGGKQTAFEVDWLMGSILFTSREVVDQVGPMNLGVFMYLEDVDWCWSMWKKGFRVIYNKEIEVYHYHGKQSGNRNFLGAFFSLLANRYSRFHLISGFKFLRKHWREKNPRELYNKNR